MRVDGGGEWLTIAMGLMENKSIHFLTIKVTPPPLRSTQIFTTLNFIL